MSILKFKRGDTFRLNVTVTTDDGAAMDITGWVIRCQVRTSDLTLVDTLTATMLQPTAGTYKLEAASTASWQLGTLVVDIEYTDAGGTVFSTDTFQVRNMESITQ